jgi:hypothetical protein
MTVSLRVATALQMTYGKTPAQARIYAAQGLSVAVYAKQDLGSVNFDASWLRSDKGEIIPAPAVGLVRLRSKRKDYSSNAPTDPARKLRYNERSAVERVNSNLKDNYGGGNGEYRTMRRYLHT